MGDVQLLGVISRDAEEPRLAYLDEPVAATPDLLALAAPVAVSEVFRLSARCEEKEMHTFRWRALSARSAYRRNVAAGGRCAAGLQYSP